MIEREEVPAATIDGLWFASTRHEISTARWTEFIRWCVDQGTPSLIAVASRCVRFVLLWECPPSIPESPVLELLTAPAVLLSRPTRIPLLLGWADQPIVGAYPHHAMRVFSSVHTTL
jgi:hypothetical protein